MMTPAPAPPSGRQIRAGVIWNALATGGEQAVGLLVQLILTRLLVPEDFGLVGMAVVFTAFVQVTSELGISAAVVQRRERDLRAIHLDVAFWTGLAAAAGAVILCAAAVGPAAAWFYEEPVLWGVVAALSVGMLLRALNSVHRALLVRALKFRELGLVTIGSLCVGGIVAVVLALSGWGVWSIVAKGIVTAAAAVPMYRLVANWRPRRRFSRAAFKDIFGFGAFVTGYDIVLQVGRKMDYLLIGKVVGASALGAYTLAFLLTNVFRQSLMSIMNRVMYPVYGKVQDSPSQAKRYYLKVVRMNVLFAFPVLALFVALPFELVTLVFGPQWADAAFPLRALALAMMIHVAGGTSASVMRGLGHARLQFHVNIFRITLVTVPVLVMGALVAGMEGVAVAMIGEKLAGRMIGQYYMKRLIGVTERDVLTAIAPGSLGAAAVIGGAFAVVTLSGAPETLVQLVVVSVLIMIPVAVVLYSELRQELAHVRSLVVKR